MSTELATTTEAAPRPNAWKPEKTKRMLDLCDADPSPERIEQIAKEYGVGAPTIRARLNTLGRYTRQPYAASSPEPTAPVQLKPWPDLGPRAFRGYTRDDMAMVARLELAMRP